jgi:hypothetical protein
MKNQKAASLPNNLFVSLKLSLIVFAIAFKSFGQTPTTFTCTKAHVSDSLISGGVLSAQDGSFGDDLRVQGNLSLTGNFLFDSPNPTGVATQTSTPYGGLVVASASGTAIATPLFPNPCVTAVQLPQYSFGGMIQAFDNANNLSLDMGSDNVNCFVDSRGGTATTGNLKVNYYCGKDILLGTNTIFQTKVFTGDYVEMRKHVQIATTSAPINDINNTAFQIFANAGKGIVLNTNNSNLIALNVTNSGGNGFTLYGDGKIWAGNKKIQSTHIHSNAEFQFNGKLACKELVVVDPTKWADFVFEENYNLMPLKELGSYYKLNKHLPDVPTESEVVKNGINISEMYAILLQKIEEQTLYNVELSKRIENLEKENRELKSKK